MVREAHEGRGWACVVTPGPERSEGPDSLRRLRR